MRKITVYTVYNVVGNFESTYYNLLQTFLRYHSCIFTLLPTCFSPFPITFFIVDSCSKEYISW